MLKACLQPPRRQPFDPDQEAVFIETGYPCKLQHDINKALSEDLKQGVAHSLCCTRADLNRKCDCSKPKDVSSLVWESYTELSDFAAQGLAQQGETVVVNDNGADAPADLIRRAGTLESQVTEDAEPCDWQCQEELESGEKSPECKAEEVYASHGLDFVKWQTAATDFLQKLGMRPHEVGSRNFSRWRGRTLWNQCFYLSIAHAYLGHQVSVRSVRGLARRFRRAIEAVVLQQHPSWSAGLEASTAGTGKAMVFADFLPLAMRTESIPVDKNLLAKCVVCIMDSINGHVEIYIGPAYRSQDIATQKNNLILLWYKPAHYQCLVRNDEDGSKVDYTYDDFKNFLTTHGVIFIETVE